MVKPKLERVARSIFHVRFPSYRYLGRAFARVQEYYESPEFRGKTFTFQEFKDWWTENSALGRKSGRFNYSSNFTGFNIPSYVLESFLGQFEDLLPEEKTLIELFSRKLGQKFYIIGTRKNGSPRTLKHEIAHGLYYINKDYRKKVLNILRKLSPKDRKKIDKYLIKNNGYHKAVLADERHAYLMTESQELKAAGIDLRTIRPIRSELNQVYNSALAA